MDHSRVAPGPLWLVIALHVKIGIYSKSFFWGEKLRARQGYRYTNSFESDLISDTQNSKDFRFIKYLLKPNTQTSIQGLDVTQVLFAHLLTVLNSGI